MLLLLLTFCGVARAQMLINIDFGVGKDSLKIGPAAIGQSTNDFWNLYSHYEPKFTPGMPLVSHGSRSGLKQADGAASRISICVSNAPGVWGNATGDAMYDSYIFSQNGSNITVAVQHLEPGRYHFYLYGHADADVTGEQNSVFHLLSGTNSFGPLTTLGSAGWKAGAPWTERHQYVVFRDVIVTASDPVIIEVASGPNGVPVLNGMQIVSRGTSPPHLPVTLAPKPESIHTNVVFREVRYQSENINDSEARFAVELIAESAATNEVMGLLFEGDVAVPAPKLPEGVRIVSTAKKYYVVVSTPGEYRLQLGVIARIQRSDPWNHISFTGPAAAVASIAAKPHSAGIEMQLLSGTPLTQAGGEVRGLIGSDRLVALRWQSKTSEVRRKSLVTVETAATAHVSPTVVKYETHLRYEILQAPVLRLTIEVPAGHTLTRLHGEQIRDWSIDDEGRRQLLTVEFIKPVEKQYTLTLLTEQGISNTPTTAQLLAPQPLEITRESGSLSVVADGAVVEIESASGLRQINAPPGTLAAYRFYARPAQLTANLKQIEPVLKIADRVTARLEETRLLIRHALTLTVEKAGVYAVELTPQPGFAVTSVQGDGVEDWTLADGKLRISFVSRVLGTRRLDVLLEQALKPFPPQITVAALPVSSAITQTAQIGAAPAAGLGVKTATESQGVREAPVSALSDRADELLAFTGEGDWKVVLAAERLPARVVAEIFNLITIGDGLVGGSATIRYGLINQGVQEFEVRLPAHWKNIEFIGPNIRRKDLVAVRSDTNYATWTVALQDKAWNGYTLVVTYDYPFDPQKAALDLRGAHAARVERETGSTAVTTAASLNLRPAPITDPLRVIDQSELAATDRALISRPVLLAYRYTGADYALRVDVTRHEELRMLEAVADRTHITSVLTDAGQMLTQASFMVKNNDKQFQRFLLPPKAEFWACYVNNEPAKAERDGDWLLVSLPRTANRDEAFGVEIVYAEKFEPLHARIFPQNIRLVAPRSDVPNTFAEWQVYAPRTLKLTSFAGTMAVLRGTTYGLRDGWKRFTDYYASLWRERGAGIVFFGGGSLFFLSMIVAAARSGKQGLIGVVVVFGILAVMAGMLLPSLAKTKARASRVQATSNLKQIGLAALLYAEEHDGRLPNTFEDMTAHLGSEKILRDPESGERFVYVGGGKTATNLAAIIAYSPVDRNGRAVAFADGSVQQMTSAQFAEAWQRQAGGEYTVNALVTSEAVAQAPARTAPAPDDARYSFRVPALQAAAGLGQVDAFAGVPVAGAIPSATPVATGLRSIRIELPRTGQPYTFTKVLNVRDEPLTVSISGMTHKWFNAWQSALQLAAFTCGLLILWVQLRRTQRNILAMTIAIVLTIGSLTSLLIAARALHAGLIAAVPIIGIILLAAVVKKLWPKGGVVESTTELPNGASPTPGPAVAAITIGFLLLSGVAASADQKTNAVSITSAAYSGTVSEKVVQFTVKLQVMTVAKEQRVTLFGEEVAIQEFTADSPDARLVREGNRVKLHLKDPGTYDAQLRFAVKLGGDVTKQLLSFGIPPALASEVALTIDEPDADVEFATAVAFKRIKEPNATRVQGIVGAGDRIELAWTPRVKRVAEMEATIFAQTRALITAGAGTVNTRARIEYQVSQGELRQMKVRIPAGERLLRVEGEMIRTWELASEGNDEILVVDLIKGAAPTYALTVETERTIETLPAQIRVAVPSAQGVVRETGLVALRAAEEILLVVEGARDLLRVDAAEFQTGKAADITAAFRYVKPDFELTARAEIVRPQVDATVRNSIRVGFEQTRMSAQIDYSIRKAGLFALRLQIPQGFKVESVTAGSNILQWVEKTDASLVDIALKQRITGDLRVHAELVRVYSELPAQLELRGVHPLDASKVTGFVSATSDAGIGIKAAAADGLTEIPAAELGDAKTASSSSLTARDSVSAGATVLAYKYLTGQEITAAAWNLALATEAIESWVRAEMVHSHSIGEAMVSGRALVRYDIQNAPVKEFRLRIPAGFTNVDVYGANIRRRDAGAEYRVELQTKVRGSYTLTVTWEHPRGSGTNIVLPAIEALNVEREAGFVVVLAKPPLQVTEQSATDQLIKADARDLPDWAGISTSHGAEAPVLVYRYLRAKPMLAVQANRFADAAVLQALAENVRLTTVVADDGQAITEMALSIRNNGKQHLEIQLPAGSSPWSSFVGGNPVRPKRSGEKLLLPLDAFVSAETAVPIEITFTGTFPFPKRKGDVTLASPQLDVPVKNARWDVYLPPDYDYSEFSGSMAHEQEIVPVLQLFSSSEYARQEQEKKSARKSELRGYLGNVRKGLSQGNVKAAVEDLSQAARLNRGEVDGDAVRELEGLQKELGKVQSSNLIQAQRAYESYNNARFGLNGAERPQRSQSTLTVKLEEEAAEQQWRALQRAQAVSTAQVQPLRVNLPTRGLRHSFTQVLQTEVQKPLTIHFEARNVATIGWIKRITLCLVGFAFLWIFVAIADARRRVVTL